MLEKFYKSDVKTKGQKNERTRAIGSRKRDLYALDLKKTAMFAPQSRKALEQLRHARLGHPYSKALRSLNNNRLVNVTTGLRGSLIVQAIARKQL